MDEEVSEKISFLFNFQINREITESPISISIGQKGRCNFRFETGIELFAAEMGKPLSGAISYETADSSSINQHNAWCVGMVFYFPAGSVC